MSASGRLERSAPAELLHAGEVVWLDPTVGGYAPNWRRVGRRGVSVHIYGCRFTDVCRARYYYVA